MGAEALTQSRRAARAKPAWRGVLTTLVARHPILGFAVSMAIMGVGMVAAVTMTTAVVLLPLALLFGW